MDQLRSLLATPRQAAEALQISQRTLWNKTFRDDPRIPHIKCGRLVRYRVIDIEKWIAEQAATTV